MDNHTIQYLSRWTDTLLHNTGGHSVFFYSNLHVHEQFDSFEHQICINFVSIVYIKRSFFPQNFYFFEYSKSQKV